MSNFHNTASINTNIGVGYNAESVIAYETSNGLTDTSYIIPTPNIGMPTTSSAYPVANSSGDYPYQPIEIVGTYDMVVGGGGYQSTTLDSPTYDVDYPANNQTYKRFPPYNQLIIEGMAYRDGATTNNVDSDFSFFRTSFQLNFIDNYAPTGTYNSTLVRPSSSETYVGSTYNSPNSAFSQFRWWNYFPTAAYNSGDYYIRIFYLPRSFARKMTVHLTFL